MEEEIWERNRAFEKLKGRGRSRSSSRPEPKPPKKEILYTVPIEQLNLQNMNPTQGNVLVDIVAVHGLGAIPDITWMERKSKVNWLCHEAMLPSAVPNARILRFGYDSLWMGKTPIRTSLSTIAYKLLLSLTMTRMVDLQRPLIFIGHCFGGLVIQRALNLAKMQQNAYPGVFDSCVGTIFLGTPHRGTRSFAQDSSLFAAIAASSDLSQSLETGILDSMKSENGALLDVTDDFVNLCSEGGPLISCFFEQRPSKLGKIIGRNDIDEFIVDQTSATLDGHRRYGLELDHFSLNKFDKPDNPSYVQVRAEIVRFYSAALKMVGASREFSDGSLSKDAASSATSISGNDTVTADKTLSLPIVHANDSVASAISVNEDEIRMKAMKELQEEEASKCNGLYQEQLQRKQLEDKRLVEQQYLKRLKQNMVKYGIENPDDIVAAYPLPDDKGLTQQEIKDKDKWYKNLIRGELLAAGIDGGQIDEILNDTGETMVFDDVDMTFTKMAKKWISTRTLDKYEIPWETDPHDKSAIIIKRWVPDYEREFLWDHSLALRNTRGRKPHPADSKAPQPRNKQNATPSTTVKEKHWMRNMVEAFVEARDSNATRRESNGSGNQVRKSSNKPFQYRNMSFQLSSDSEDERLRHRRSHTPLKSVPIKATDTPGYRRTASTDSIHSAPDYQEVNRRRRNSRALSGSRERVPIASHLSSNEGCIMWSP
ncbi:hypothetical protein DE146DRAFT_677647 [Phaeosphaeria sp. MPI-PUGE-AT-0046c]|nr:hypothetical protein DE146DRAFT_677647 [Phaeosphaeria sp. MPI-PUGE-AT-0046c]